MSCKTRRVGAVSLCIFIFSFLATFTATISTETDIACLKSVKASLEDPFGYLNSSWNFNNNIEGFICRFAGVDCGPDDENKVLSLSLYDMGLKGRFPRGLQNCTSLTVLDLTNNELYGQIPFDIQKLLPSVTLLDLSSNKFSGEIPLSIANCSNLTVLRLDNNSLTGHIPQGIGLLSRLKWFSVANNLLSGAVPNFNSTYIGSYANNSGLCGRPLERCRVHSEKFHWRFVYSFKDGFAIGYAVSLISAMVIYASYCVPWVHAGTKDERITITTMVMMMMKRKSKKTELDHLESSSTLEFLLENEVSMLENFVTRMSFEELSNATENFSQNNIIENGETGIMYKATLPNGWFLAVKKIYNSQQSEEHFISELKILGRLRHDHLLPLLGFCKESNKKLLVYKYLSNGNLFDWLHSTEDKRKTLQWPLRMKIAVGLARGLAWLHHCCYFRVAHLNINSKCVLLDRNFKPKLSNFGRATLVNPNEINSNRGFVMDDSGVLL
ncbi:probably inactive leucine-rich repeat receptor-like protein kinase At5g48380 [Jatropha curcas]|uniref:probably inactive leucine-rich repeat receptor-like protein kinase At5g48380 n=1 Tax=Jatropha curcas TaxID=180498 RepID=UPI001892E4E8|nr:probably inactive leucine-rich repeat receptor-like protein kinase At5g48380 [Jatropha curcas]